MQPWLAVPGAAFESPCIRNPLRPYVPVAASGTSGITYGPCETVVRGNRMLYRPRGIGPTFGTFCMSGLFLPASAPLYPCVIVLPLGEISAPSCCFHVHITLKLLGRQRANLTRVASLGEGIAKLCWPVHGIKPPAPRSKRPSGFFRSETTSPILRTTEVRERSRGRRVTKNHAAHDLGAPALQFFYAVFKVGSGGFINLAGGFKN